MIFDQLNVDDRFTSAELEVTADAIREFARQYDPQPIHTDDEAAGQTMFGGLIASGWHTCALTMKLMAEARILGSTPLIGVQVDELRFEHPLRPGDRIHAEATLLRKTVSKNSHRQFISLAVSTVRDDGTVLLTQRWTVLVT